MSAHGYTIQRVPTLGRTVTWRLYAPSGALVGEYGARKRAAEMGERLREMHATRAGAEARAAKGRG